jgi:ferredoxin-NADP reductase
VAIALSFAHQFASGTDFATHPTNRVVWVGLYALAFGLLLVYRVVAPVRSNTRRRMRVAGVVREGPGAVSVYVTGRDLEGMGAEAGQFFLWRFLTGETWWQAHPFSLSAAPNPEWLRFTAKDVGDFTGSLGSLEPGTAVIAEGPYGAFTARRRTQRRVLLIAGGIGITPLRALLESLPARKGDLTLIYRASSDRDVVLRDELDQIAARRGATVHYLIGPRGSRVDLDPHRIRSLCADVRGRDVYLCGPPGFTTHVRAILDELEVPAARIHTEEFEF